jgi:hypothetical protein
MIVNNNFRTIKVEVNDKKKDLPNIDINLFYVKELRKIKKLFYVFLNNLILFIFL